MKKTLLSVSAVIICLLVGVGIWPNAVPKVQAAPSAQDMRRLSIEEFLLLNQTSPVWLGGIDLSNTVLIGVDLAQANLTWANLSNAYMSGADLTEAGIFYADLSAASLNGAKLVRAGLAGTDLSEADLTESSLMWANLEEANFSRHSCRC